MVSSCLLRQTQDQISFQIENLKAFVTAICITFSSRHFLITSKETRTILPPKTLSKRVQHIEPALIQFTFLKSFLIGQLADSMIFTNHNKRCKIEWLVSGVGRPRDRAVRYRHSRWRLTGFSSVELFFGQHHGENVALSVFRISRNV